MSKSSSLKSQAICNHIIPVSYILHNAYLVWGCSVLVWVPLIPCGMIVASENPGIALLCQIPKKQPQWDAFLPAVFILEHCLRDLWISCAKFSFDICWLETHWTVQCVVCPEQQNTNKQCPHVQHMCCNILICSVEPMFLPPEVVFLLSTYFLNNYQGNKMFKLTPLVFLDGIKVNDGYHDLKN